jgi:hypothetical protein
MSGNQCRAFLLEIQCPRKYAYPQTNVDVLSNFYKGNSAYLYTETSLTPSNTSRTRQQIAPIVELA